MTEVKKNPKGSFRTWCYTINNYTEDDINRVKALTGTMHRCCKEVGTTDNTPHLQGAITFSRTYRLAALKKLIPRAHWEVAKACDPENYCIKGEIIIDERNNNQGHRTDLGNAIEVGRTLGYKQMAKECPETFVKYHKGLKELLFTIHEQQDWFDTKVYVFWGPPGSGKSKRARTIDPNLYNVPEPINGALWFDGYMGQKSILLDDFYGWIKYHTLLQLTDGYPITMPIKGSFVHRQWDTVIITSNKPPELWYNREEIAALKRRITSIEHVTVTEVGGNTITPTSICWLDELKEYPEDNRYEDSTADM